MEDLLQEFVNSRGIEVGVDRTSSVIRGVKLLGLDSRNQRRYLPTALARAVTLYEGAKVNVNHSKGNPLAARDYQDRLGTIRGVQFRDGKGLFGDLHFNPKHQLAEQLLWDAQHAVENVGFSHNVVAKTSRQADQLVVEEILQVQSVDLVADPATTRGLYEAVETGADETQALQEELLALRQEVATLRQAQTNQQRQVRIQELLAEYDLLDRPLAEGHRSSLLTPLFQEQLLAAADEVQLRRLIEDRAKLAQHLAPASSGQRPVARGQHPLDAPLNLQEQVAQLVRVVRGTGTLN